MLEVEVDLNRQNMGQPSEKSLSGLETNLRADRSSLVRDFHTGLTLDEKASFLQCADHVDHANARFDDFDCAERVTGLGRANQPVDNLSGSRR